jgi:H/ACA ribonucleoprotein complex subunit 2
MGKDNPDKERKKEKKKEKRLSEADGVHKSKPDKKDKKDKKDRKRDNPKFVEATEKELLDQSTSKVFADSDTVDKAEENGDGHVVQTRPIGALVPFANPLVEDKTAKKVFRSVKKGII